MVEDTETHAAQTVLELREGLEDLMKRAKEEQDKMPSWAFVQIGLFMLIANSLVLIAEQGEKK